MNSFRTAGCIILVLLFAACGGEAARTGDTGAEAAAGVSPGASSDATGLPLPCGSMTAVTAAEILNVAETEVVFAFSEELRTCSFRVDPMRAVSYSVYAETDPGTAAAEMARVVDGLGAMADCDPVEALGDEAIYCHGEHTERLLVRRGEAWFDVRSPTGLEAMTAVARAVLQ